MQNNLQEIYNKSNSWPFLEAKRILKKINNQAPKKGYVLFETGYGPSGLPHIGTFGEVVRTCYVKKAFELLAPNIPTKLICISDDIDGLRKVPSNLPNQELIAKNTGKPLTIVPDPFQTHASFGHHMNDRLRSFLDSFGFDYEFISATDKYKNGDFDKTMLKVLEKYEEIMDLMLPTLGSERQKTYSPFMPIDPETNIVIDKGVIGIDKAKGLVKYIDTKGSEKEISVTGGNCKLQWKVDFGARWYSFGVDYEIYGKDHLPNEPIYRKICQILGGKPPINFTYEMFLSEDGSKISKSSGNGISVEDWLKYAPSQSMALYMYQKPKTAKRLHFDVIPKAMDEYLAFVNNFPKQESKQQIENPAFHVHFGEVPHLDLSGLTYSLILNLVSACNPENDDILWGFIQKYQPKLNKENAPILSIMLKCAINYYNDFIKSGKKYKIAQDNEKAAILKLKAELSEIDEDLEAKEIQNLIFAVGREFGYENNMKDWFAALYQILLGQETGPRMGSFIALYGIKNFINMVDTKIN